MFSKFNTFDKYLLVFGIFVNLFFGILTKSSLIALCNALSSIIGAVFSAKGSPLGYVFGLIETITYIIVSYSQKYYAEVIINLFGFIPLSIYGFFSWLKNMNGQTKSIEVKTLSKKEIYIAFISQIVLSYGYYLLLVYFDTNMPILSTISLILTILGMYFGTRMSVLTYEIYIIHCVFKFVLWLVPIINGNLDNVPVLIATVLYFISDIYGLINWNRLKKIQNNKDEQNEN